MLFRFGSQQWTFPGIRVMGILNVTPDSFFDGGKYSCPKAALERARQMVDQGADLIDVGGESTRPMAPAIAADEELARVLPVIRQLRVLGVPISIDTAKSQVARAAVAEGASIINDVTAGRADPAIFKVAAETRAGLILMHSRGDSRTMQSLAQYGAIAEEVLSELQTALASARAAGVQEDRSAIDPGFGFAKTAEQNVELLRQLQTFHRLGRPMLVGVSRKSFLGALLGNPAADRLAASLSAQFLAALRGCDMIRTHDVRETVEMLKILKAILAAAPSNMR